MMAGMPQSQVHTSDLDLTQDSIRTSASGGSGGGGCYTGLPVKLLVRGFSNAFTLDDLWQLFTTYGEVSSVILEVSSLKNNILFNNGTIFSRVTAPR